MPRTAEATDEQLALRAAGGALDAFESLVERHGGAVIAALERQLGDHHLALDGAQEVWVKLHRYLHRYRPESAFRPWLFSIALNHGRDLMRKRGRRAGHEEDDASEHVAPAWTDPSQPAEERDAITRALSRVDGTFREALVLVDVLGFGYDEAALALGVAIGTAKSRVSRGRRAFREAFQELQGVDGQDSSREPAARARR